MYDERAMIYGQVNISLPCPLAAPSINLFLSKIERHLPSFIPMRGLQTVASNPMLHTEEGQSAFIIATSSRKCKFECASITPRKAGIYLRISNECKPSTHS